MSTGGKIAVGCAIAVVVVGLAAIALVGGTAYWLKGKTDGFVQGENRIEELRQRANRNVFTRPADGVIREDQLLKFLEVRKRVYAVYEKHEAQLQALSKKEKGDLSDLTTGYTIITELRDAHAAALADAGMSEDEYRFLVEQVYKTGWAAEAQKQPEDTPAVDVPPANLALFRKYEDRIRPYAMGGLEWVGL